MKVIISFEWRSHKITKFVEWDTIVDNINKKTDFWGEFTVDGGNRYRYKISWSSSKVAIFNEIGAYPIDVVCNFKIHFSDTYNF